LNGEKIGLPKETIEGRIEKLESVGFVFQLEMEIQRPERKRKAHQSSDEMRFVQDNSLTLLALKVMRTHRTPQRRPTHLKYNQRKE